MNHACTYFDRGYLAQGLALWASLARHDAAAVLPRNEDFYLDNVVFSRKSAAP